MTYGLTSDEVVTCGIHVVVELVELRYGELVFRGEIITCRFPGSGIQCAG